MFKTKWTDHTISYRFKLYGDLFPAIFPCSGNYCSNHKVILLFIMTNPIEQEKGLNKTLYSQVS